MSRYIAYGVRDSETGGVLDRLTLERRPLKRGQVRIRVERAGVAFGDVLRARNILTKPRSYPLIPGYDVTGRMEETGPGVRDLEAGMPVCAFLVVGGYSEEAVADSRVVVPLPEDVPMEAGVALSLNYVTAWQMIERVARVRPGDRALVQSAAGGVGTALLQLLALKGVKVYGTASASKHDLVRQLGAEPIDYRNEDFVEVLKRREPGGLDAVFETAGISAAYRSRTVLRRHGILIPFGFVGDWNNQKMVRSIVSFVARTLPLLVFRKGRRIRMYSILPSRHPDWYREDLQELWRLYREGRIAPVIHEVLPLHRAQQAQDMLVEGGVRGKLLLDCTQV